MNVILFGKRVFADVIKDLKIGSSSIMWGGLLKLKDWGPDKRTHRNTEVRLPWWCRG